MRLPKKGMDGAAVFRKLEKMWGKDLNWQDGRAFGYIFDSGKEVMEVGKNAYTMFLSENGLDFTAFKSLQKLEKDLAAFGAAHLYWDF